MLVSPVEIGGRDIGLVNHLLPILPKLRADTLENFVVEHSRVVSEPLDAVAEVKIGQLAEARELLLLENQFLWIRQRIRDFLFHGGGRTLSDGVRGHFDKLVLLLELSSEAEHSANSCYLIHISNFQLLIIRLQN